MLFVLLELACNMVSKSKDRNGDLIMKYLRLIRCGVMLFLTVTLLPLSARGAESLPHPDSYLPHQKELYKLKKVTDDSTDLTAAYPLKDALPPEIYNLLTFNVEEAKKQTAEILGFSSPDLVGKITPEVKPGKYTYEEIPGAQGLVPSRAFTSH